MIRYEIRDIAESDSDQLVALWRATWIATYTSSLGHDAVAGMLEALERNRLGEMLPGNGERGICIVGDGEVIGSIVIAQRGAKAYVWGLYIKPEHQRCGLGTRLLAAAAAVLPQEITVEVRVLFTSEPAIFFYRKHGFVEVETERTMLPGNVGISTAVMAVPVEDLRHPALTSA